MSKSVTEHEVGWKAEMSCMGTMDMLVLAIL